MYKNIQDRRDYDKQWYNKNKSKILQQKKIYVKNKYNKLKELKSTLKCSTCGENDPRCLDFHHVDPTTKTHDVGRMVVKGSWKKVLEEIDKCIVLCSNCHRKIQFESC